MSIPSVFELHHFDSLASTNDTARSLIHRGCPGGTVVTAKIQTAGRGRQGRTWLSLPGALLCSIVCYPEVTPELFPRAGFAACVAISRAAEGLAGERTGIKWPNDLVLKRTGPLRKWGGILVEAGSESGRPWLVIGAGLNLMDSNSRLESSWGSLSEIAGASVEPDEMLTRVLLELERMSVRSSFVLPLGDTDWWQMVIEEWRSRDALLGRMASALVNDYLVRGRCAGITSSGAVRLELDRQNGPLQQPATLEIESGDVHLVSTGDSLDAGC